MITYLIVLSQTNRQLPLPATLSVKDISLERNGSGKAPELHPFSSIRTAARRVGDEAEERSALSPLCSITLPSR